MHDRIKRTMANVWGVPFHEIPDDASAENLKEWDSLGHMNLMLALETEFGVHLPAEIMLELLSLPEIELFLAHRKMSSAE